MILIFISFFCYVFLIPVRDFRHRESSHPRLGTSSFFRRRGRIWINRWEFQRSAYATAGRNHRYWRGKIALDPLAVFDNVIRNSYDPPENTVGYNGCFSEAILHSDLHSLKTTCGHWGRWSLLWKDGLLESVWCKRIQMLVWLGAPRKNFGLYHSTDLTDLQYIIEKDDSHLTCELGSKEWKTPMVTIQVFQNENQVE